MLNDIKQVLKVQYFSFAVVRTESLLQLTYLPDMWTCGSAHCLVFKAGTLLFRTQQPLVMDKQVKTQPQ